MSSVPGTRPQSVPPDTHSDTDFPCILAGRGRSRCVCHKLLHSHTAGTARHSQGPSVPRHTPSHSALQCCRVGSGTPLSPCHTLPRSSHSAGYSLAHTFPWHTPVHSSLHAAQRDTDADKALSHDHRTPLMGNHISSYTQRHNIHFHTLHCMSCPGSLVCTNRYHDDGDILGCSAAYTCTPRSSQDHRPTWDTVGDRTFHRVRGHTGTPHRCDGNVHYWHSCTSCCSICHKSPLGNRPGTCLH